MRIIALLLSVITNCPLIFKIPLPLIVIWECGLKRRVELEATVDLLDVFGCAVCSFIMYLSDSMTSSAPVHWQGLLDPSLTYHGFYVGSDPRRGGRRLMPRQRDAWTKPQCDQTPARDTDARPQAPPPRAQSGAFRSESPEPCMICLTAFRCFAAPMPRAVTLINLMLPALVKRIDPSFPVFLMDLIPT